MKCFECGGEGHIAKDCDFANSSGPPWCGICEQRTRLTMTADDRAVRCPECHPLRHQRLPQHYRCPHCKMIVHEWDNGTCGHHSSPAAKDNRLPIDQIQKLIDENTVKGIR